MLSKQEAKQHLKEKGLRATAPRIAVMLLLSEQNQALSHSEVVRLLGEVDWDPATNYRNLTKLTEVGLVKIVSRAEGMARYKLQTNANGHFHPHFHCEDCGTVSCLPEDTQVTLPANSRWRASLQKASIQLQGNCPDCIEKP